MQYRGGCSVPRGDTIFRDLSTEGDIMIHVEGYQEYRGSVHYRGDTQITKDFSPMHGTHDIPHVHHNIPHGTAHTLYGVISVKVAALLENRFDTVCGGGRTACKETKLSKKLP